MVDGKEMFAQLKQIQVMFAWEPMQRFLAWTKARILFVGGFVEHLCLARSVGGASVFVCSSLLGGWPFRWEHTEHQP